MGNGLFFANAMGMKKISYAIYVVSKPKLKSSMPSAGESQNRRTNLANKPTGMVVLCDGATEATLKYERSSKIYD